MNSLMTYRGYHASIQFDEEDQIFVCKVLGIVDSLNFHGRSVDELHDSFQESVDTYINFCKTKGKEPEKEFKGVFNVRISPEVHKQLALEAADEGITMNQFVAQAINEKLERKVL